MPYIKNIHLVEDPEKMQILEAGALLHRRYARIEFKIKELTEDYITVQAVQGDTPYENFCTGSDLVRITKELFGSVYEDKTIRVRPIPYDPSPMDEITPEWILEQIKKVGKKKKYIARDLDMPATDITAHHIENKPLSRKAKAMYYYYFRSKELEKFIEANGLEVPPENRKRAEIERKRAEERAREQEQEKVPTEGEE